MAGGKKAPVKLIAGIWGSLALVVVLTFLLAKWEQRDHQTMGGLPAFVRSYAVDSGTYPLLDDKLRPKDFEHAARKRKTVSALMHHANVAKLEDVMRDVLKREGYSLPADPREARIVAEIGIAPEKPESAVPIVHSLRLLDIENNCMLAFMCCNSRLAVPDTAQYHETDAGALWTFYRQNGLALRRGKEDAFYSLLKASADPNRWGDVLYVSRPDTGQSRHRAILDFGDRVAELRGAPFDWEIRLYRSIYKAGLDVAHARDGAELRISVKWTHEESGVYTDGTTGDRIASSFLVSSPDNESGALELSIDGSSPQLSTGGHLQEAQTSWQTHYEKREPDLIAILQKVVNPRQ